MALPFESSPNGNTAATIVGDKTGNLTLDRARAHFEECLRWANNRMESRRRDFIRRYGQYRGNMNAFGRDAVQAQLRSQLWIPRSGALVETVLPKTIGDDPTLEILPASEADVDAAQRMGPLVQYYLRAGEFGSHLYNWWKDCLVYGTGWVEVVWSFVEERRVRQMPPMMLGAAPQEMETDVVVEDMPRIQWVDIMDVIPDYTASTPEKADFLIKRYELPLHIVIDRIRRGVYQGISEDEAKGLAGMDVKGPPGDRQQKDERDQAAYGFAGRAADSDRQWIDKLPRVVAYDYWGRFDLDGDIKDENSRLTALGPGGLRMVRARLNPFLDGQKPLVNAHFIPVPNDIYGIGLMEWTEQLQREINTRYNMGIDNANYINNQMLKVKRSAHIPDAQLKGRPSGRIDVNDQDDVMVLETKPIYGELMAAQTHNDYLWNITSGVSTESSGVRQQGAQTAAHRTVGGLLALQQAADSRLKMPRLLFERRVRKAGELFLSRIKQYMTAPVTVQMIGPSGPEFLMVRPWQINASDYNLLVNIAPTEQVGKLAEREKWAQMFMFFKMNDPDMLLFEWGNIYEDMVGASGLPNPQRYLGQMREKLQMIQGIKLLEASVGGPMPMIGAGRGTPSELGRGPGSRIEPQQQESGQTLPGGGIQPPGLTAAQGGKHVGPR